MSAIERPDSSWEHLYPPFRDRLRKVLAAVERETGEPWKLVEGYRSTARQLWLYASGRTRPGPVVTWKRSPTWHGTGLAADVAPAHCGYHAPRSHWEALRRCWQAEDLDNPAWEKGDLGHVQLTDYSVRARALEWVRSGFLQLVSRAQPQVAVNGEPVRDARVISEGGAAWVQARPVCDALSLAIVEARDGQIRIADDEREIRLPMKVEIVSGQVLGFAPARGLEQLGATVRWNAERRLVEIVL